MPGKNSIRHNELLTKLYYPVKAPPAGALLSLFGIRVQRKGQAEGLSHFPSSDQTSRTSDPAIRLRDIRERRSRKKIQEIVGNLLPVIDSPDDDALSDPDVPDDEELTGIHVFES